MVLKLYGPPYSVSLRRAALICKEKDVQYEIVPVNVPKRENKAAAFLSKNPLGQVPFFEDDDGFTLYESRAIARYIATKYADRGPSLIPSEPKAVAVFEQAASLELTSFEPYAHGIMYEKVLKKKWTGEDGSAEFAAGHMHHLNDKLDAYETILGKQKYLAGEEITLADLFHLPYGWRLPEVGFDITKGRPNVERWWKDISDRPAWKAVKENA